MNPIHELINSVLEVNGSWREAFNDITEAMRDGEDPDLEGSIIADYISNDLNITEDQAIEGIKSFVIENYIVT